MVVRRDVGGLDRDVGREGNLVGIPNLGAVGRSLVSTGDGTGKDSSVDNQSSSRRSVSFWVLLLPTSLSFTRRVHLDQVSIRQIPTPFRGS